MEPTEQQLRNLITRYMSATSLKIMKLLDGNDEGLSCREIVAFTELPNNTVKAWIKNNLYREKKTCHKITQFYDSKTKGQKYILSSIGKLIVEQLKQKSNPTTVMNATNQTDIFNLLGVERAVPSAVQQLGNPAIAKYEEMLVMVERKKIELSKAETKLREMIRALSNLAAVENEICVILGQPISPAQNKVVAPDRVATPAGGMILNPKTAAILEYIKEMGAVKTTQIAAAAGIPATKMSTWVWNALNNRKDNAYIRKDNDGYIAISSVGEKYLQTCKKTGMSYPKLIVGYENIQGNGIRSEIGTAILHLLLEKGPLYMLEIVKELGAPKEKVQQWVYNNASGSRAYLEKGEDFRYKVTETGKKRLNKTEELV